MTRGLSLLGPFAIAIACASGDEGPNRPATTIADDTGSTTAVTASASGDDSGDDDGSTPCVPGQQIACPCPGGTDGAQACNDAGTGYEPCVCPGDDETGESGESTGSMTSATTGTSDTGMTNDCAPDQTCDACALCSLETACKELYDACASLEICGASANCVLECGFTLSCAQQCAPADDSERAQLFEELTLCVAGVCPQCLNG